MTLVAVLLVGAFVPAGPGRPALLAPRPALAAIPPGWTTYHYDNARDGNDTAEPAYGAQTGSWTSPTLDGAIYASPLIWSGLVFAATENNTVYALRETDGSIYWTSHLANPASDSALSCGNIHPVVGITGTPVIDPSSGILYAAGLVGTPTLKHVLWAIDVATGQPAAPARDLVFSDLDPRAAGQRGALALANGNVYVPFGGRAGDCLPYHPRVAGVPTNGGPIFGYQPQTGGQQGAGFWAPSGEAIDGIGNLFLATGNGFSTTCTVAGWDHGDAVVKLTPGLVESDYFVPPNWCSLNASDTDLGSVAPLLLPGNLAYTTGKSGEGWVIDTTNLGHFSSKAGVKPDTCTSVYGGLAAAGGTVYVPCENELVAIRNLSTGAPPFTVAWHQPITVGAPIVVGGSVWALEEYGTNLRRIDPSTGTSMTFPIGGHNRFQTPAADSARIFAVGGGQVHEINFGNITPPPPPTRSSGVFHALAPSRIMDTRLNQPFGAFAAGQTKELHVLGGAGVPTSGVSAVVLNVTAVDATTPGWIAAFPGGTGYPGGSHVNFTTGPVATANLVVAPVGGNGNVAFLNGAPGAVQLIADVFGYFDTAGSGAGPAGRYRAVTPSRLLDTRSTGGRLAPGGTVTVPIVGQGGVPAGASAVALNVTAVGPDNIGFLAAFAQGASWNGTSNVNFGPGAIVPNRVVVPLGPGGVTIKNDVNDSVDVLVDISGWFTDGSNLAATGGVYTPLTPGRLLDTRFGGSPLGAGETRPIAVAGHNGVPASGAAVVSINLTATDETYPGMSFIAAFPDPGPWPNNSDLNTIGGGTTTNAVLVGLGAGKFDLIHADGSADVIVDVEGWFS